MSGSKPSPTAAVASGKPLARTSGLTKRYGGIVAIDALDFSVKQGEICGVIGPNGAGKSTFVGLLGGAIKPSAGQIFFDEQDVTERPASERARLGIGRTYQIPRPFLEMTVAENLQVAQLSVSMTVPPSRLRSECEELLELTGLTEVAHRPARVLPLLRRKRLEVARALALKPKLLLLDEVGAGLLDTELTELISLIKSLTSPNRAIIIVEHIIRLVRECCERLVVLEFGRQLAAGSTAIVLANDDVAAAYLGTSRATPPTAAAMAPLPVGPNATTRPIDETASVNNSSNKALAAAESGLLLEVEGVSAGYGQAKVLHGIDLVLKRGETAAILGINGAGKTTLAKAVTGMIKVTEGRLRIAGEDVTNFPAHLIAGRGIAHCMEGRRIFPSLSVEENLLIAARGANTYELKHRFNQVFDLFPLLSERRKTPGTLMSGGQQQMLAIGRALMGKPQLIIFDEISLGLAPNVIDRLYEALLRLRASGVAMIVIEQDVDRALLLAQNAYVLERGKVALTGPSEVVGKDPRLRHLYIGEADAHPKRDQ
jgi:branched-chain amino acid transport system ATP-binding protein